MRYLSMYIWCNNRYSKEDIPLDRQPYINHCYNKLKELGFNPMGELFNQDLVDPELSIMTLYGDN